WLIKLGWWQTLLKKGVYMDGHEHADVMAYRQNVFLPAMAEFEAWIAKFEGPDLKCVPPELKLGEKEIIANCQDESCFTANEYKWSAWLEKDETILQKKGQGRLIHVSNFINAENGHLVYCDADNIVIEEAQKIIYPGSNGDAWWDAKQLLAQMDHTIQVFEKAHPDCVGLFIFDQSSAHTSLPSDALKAFEMNKSNGGKQRKQHDTIIPDSNPYPKHRGKVQKMTLPDGQPKGLQQVLEEHGFNIQNIQAKCSPICPVKNHNCCMAQILSHQEDFTNQISELETLIKSHGHKCIFLPKFHCELNPN
ncbi:hypothetical protein J132_03781, partial [Termitomyces sp. J132]